jgi:hypothetical protein
MDEERLDSEMTFKTFGMLATFAATVMFTPAHGLPFSPLADAAAMVMVPSEDGSGCARFSVLSAQLIRMEHSTTQRVTAERLDWVFQDNATQFVLNRRRVVPAWNHTLIHEPFSMALGAGRLARITTTALTLTYDPAGDGSFSRTSLTVLITSTKATWAFGADPMTEGQSLLGSIRTLDWVMHGLWEDGHHCCDDTAYPQWLNCTWMDQHPLAWTGCTEDPATTDCSNYCTWGLLGRKGWSVVQDRTASMLGDAPYPNMWPSGLPSPDNQDMYMFAHGIDYRAALADMIAIAGNIPLVPRYTLGVMASGWHKWTSAGIQTRVANYSGAKMPIDTFIFDMDWHQHPDWGSYTWDSQLIPNHTALVAWLHAKGIGVGVNIHDNSGVGSRESQFDAFAHAIGVDPKSIVHNHSSLGFDLLNKTWAVPFMQLVIDQIGVDVLWPDYQFPTIARKPGGEWLYGRNATAGNPNFPDMYGARFST